MKTIKNMDLNVVSKSLLQIATRDYYKLRQLTATRCSLTNCDDRYNKLRQVLQIVTLIKNATVQTVKYIAGLG